MKLVLLACVVLLAMHAFADRWTFFYPASVISFGCKTAEFTEIHFGEKGGVDYFQAVASAKRNDESLGEWKAELGRFPHTTKGRHQAEKLCSRWVDEATKRVSGAHGQ